MIQRVETEIYFLMWKREEELVLRLGRRRSVGSRRPRANAFGDAEVLSELVYLCL